MKRFTWDTSIQLTSEERYIKEIYAKDMIKALSKRMDNLSSKDMSILLEMAANCALEIYKEASWQEATKGESV